MADLVKQVEDACSIAMGTVPSDAAMRTQAQQSVVALSESLDNMGLIQAVLDQSTNNAAITACAQALQKLCTDHWNVLSDAMRLEMRNYILNLLASKGTGLESYAVRALVMLLCRVTKYAWFDAPPPAQPGAPASKGIRSIVGDASRFLEATVHHALIGLTILNELVTEMNQKNRNRTLTQHRKVAISFRDETLLEVFEVALSMLNKCATCAIQTAALAPQQAEAFDNALLEQSLLLVINCLNFDFLGVSPDESVEEHAVLQVPNSWRDRIQNGATLRLLFNVYKGCTTGKIPLVPDAPPPNHSDAAAAAIIMHQATQPFRVSVDRAAQTLEALCMYISIRRTLFATEADRRRFLTHTLRGVNDILAEQAGMADSDCFHHLCRLLSKIKTNFQLTEIAKCDGYAEWLNRVADLTTAACTRPMWAKNSLHYILSLWAKLVAAVPYAKLESGGAGAGGGAAGGGAGGMPGGAADPLLLEKYIPNIVGAYVTGQLASLTSDEAEEALESLADLESMEDQLEHLAVLMRYQYEANTAILVSMLDPLMGEYEKALGFVQANHGAILGGAYKDQVAALRLLECKLAQFVALMGPVVGHTASSGVTSMLGGPPGEEQYDAELSSRVLKLMAMLDQRLAVAASIATSNPHQPPGMVQAMTDLFKPDLRLELAVLLFIDNFKRAYISESCGMPAPAPPAPPVHSGAGGASSALLLSAAAGKGRASLGRAGGGAGAGDSGMDGSAAGGGAGGGPGGAGAERYDPTDYAALLPNANGRQKAFMSFFQRMNLGNHVTVIGVVLGKLANNLRYWTREDAVLRASLNVFHDLVFGYTSGKLLLSMQQVATLLTNHGPDAFPFLAVPANTRFRTKFYTCLARLVFLEEDSERLEPFMAPILAGLNALAPAVAAANRSEQVQRALTGTARDLRGILAAAQSRGAYVSVFELLHPKHVDTLIRGLELFADTPSVTTPVLKMLAELCFQRGGRIAFGTNSPNGILLFRAASQAIVSYGARLAPFVPPAGSDAYALKYKGVMLCAALLNKCLDGGFVNFGVFQLYGDRAADGALEMVFNLLGSVPPAELLTLPKLAQQSMLFLHYVTRSHLDTLTALPPPQFQHLIALLRQGLDHVDTDTSLQAASAWDHIASSFVKNARKETPGAAALRAQVAQMPGLFESLMKMLFSIIVFNETSAQWSLLRALLPAILAAEVTSKDALESFRAELVASQPGSLQPRMADEFNKLCADVTRSLDMANRDRFAQRLAVFRTTVREFAAV